MTDEDKKEPTWSEIEAQRWEQQQSLAHRDIAVRVDTNDIQRMNIRRSVRTNALHLALEMMKTEDLDGRPFEEWADYFVNYIEKED